MAPFDDVESLAEGAHTETTESIADEVRHETRLGHVQDDVSHVLEERLAEAGIDLRPEEVGDTSDRGKPAYPPGERTTAATHH